MECFHTEPLILMRWSSDKYVTSCVRMNAIQLSFVNLKSQSFLSDVITDRSCGYFATNRISFCEFVNIFLC